jgi:hypothetical protein
VKIKDEVEVKIKDEVEVKIKDEFESKSSHVSLKEKVEDLKEKVEDLKEKLEEQPLNRSKLLKKYGIGDVNEEEVENIINSYRGGSISDDDVEKIELTLMNHIKKSILRTPKIRGTEVLVFLDNHKELTGTINIITEYESQSFISKIMGQSRNVEDLQRQMVNIAEIEIKKSFRHYPKVVDKFNVNVEFI